MKEFQDKREQDNHARKIGSIQKAKQIEETNKQKELIFDQKA